MAYSSEEKENILNSIFESISNGDSLRTSLCINKISSQTFFKWIDSDIEKSKQYARACEMRAESMADEIIEIADENNADVYVDDNGVARIDGNAVQRSRLKVEARKWLISKMNPKKYGDKIDIDHTTKGESINNITDLSALSNEELQSLKAIHDKINNT